MSNPNLIPDIKMKQIKIGIIGIGRMGQIHLDNLIHKFSEAQVIAISDINREAKHWAEKYTISKFYEDYKDLISDEEINTVVICSPTNQHAENIIAAAQAGKDTRKACGFINTNRKKGFANR